jgi:site-specific DNA-methyltransferase (adenine-specific)
MFARVGQADLYHGDCDDLLWDLKLDHDLQADIAITSPPYRLGKDYDDQEMSYVDYLTWLGNRLDTLYCTMADEARLCLNVPMDTSFGGEQRPLGPDALDMARSAGWKYFTTITWAEGNIGRRTAWGSWIRATAPYVTNPDELIYVLYKGDRWKREADGRTSTIAPEQFKAWTLGHWKIQGAPAKKLGHPAPYPEELVERLLRLFSFEEDLVVDPFLGSGTTCLVANRLGRRSIGIDTSKEYLQSAAIRLAKAQGQTVLFDADGVPHVQGELAA